VLAIGGLKEKLTAAVRGGVKTVIIPKSNKRDLKEVPEEIKKQLDIRTISDASELPAIVFE
jgi:ATP-dependent Lon protease